MEEHEKALNLLAHQLKDYVAAIEYCRTHSQVTPHHTPHTLTSLTPSTPHPTHPHTLLEYFFSILIHICYFLPCRVVIVSTGRGSTRPC